MAQINFPSPATHGMSYVYQGISYTFDDGNAGAGAAPGGGWWFVGSVGSYGSCTGQEIDIGTNTVKFATPFAIANSLLVKEASDGVTRLTYNGVVVAETTSTGMLVPGTLVTQNLSLLGNLTIPGILFSGGVESKDTVKVEVAGVGDAGYVATNDNGGLGLTVDLSSGLNLYSTNNSGLDIQKVIQYARNGGTVLHYNNLSKLNTLSDGIQVTGKVLASGTVSGTDLTATGKVNAVIGFEVSSGTTIEVTSEFKTSEGEAKFTKSGTAFELTTSDAGGLNVKTSYKVDHAGGVGIYYNGVQKFTTTSGGISVVGNVGLDTISASGDITISSGTLDAAFVSYAAGGGGYFGGVSTVMEIGTCAFGGTSRKPALTSQQNGETALYHNGASVFETNINGVQVGTGFFIDTSGAARNANNSFVLSANGDLRTTNSIHNDNATLAQDGTVISNTGKARFTSQANTSASCLVGNTIARAALNCVSSSGLVSIQRQSVAGSVLQTGITISSDNSTRMYYGNGSLIRLTTTSGGGIQYGTWTNPALSDPTVKKNVVARSGIENILALNGVDWDWIDADMHSEEEPTSGFLADNYQASYPKQVDTRKCMIEEFKESHNFMLYQEEDRLTPEELQTFAEEQCADSNKHVGKLQINSNVSDKTFDADLVESIKFLHKELMSLKEEVADLKIRNKVLEDEVLGLGL